VSVSVSASVLVSPVSRISHFEGEHIQYSGLTHALRWFVGSSDMPNGQQGGSAMLSVITMCVVEMVEVPHGSSISYVHCQINPGRSNFTMVSTVSVSFSKVDILSLKERDAILAKPPVTVRLVVTSTLPPKGSPPIFSLVPIASATNYWHRSRTHDFKEME
jgi:hypothetical protein